MKNALYKFFSYLLIITVFIAFSSSEVFALYFTPDIWKTWYLNSNCLAIKSADLSSNVTRLGYSLIGSKITYISNDPNLVLHLVGNQNTNYSFSVANHQYDVQTNQNGEATTQINLPNITQVYNFETNNLLSNVSCNQFAIKYITTEELRTSGSYTINMSTNLPAVVRDPNAKIHFKIDSSTYVTDFDIDLFRSTTGKDREFLFPLISNNDGTFGRFTRDITYPWDHLYEGLYNNEGDFDISSISKFLIPGEAYIFSISAANGGNFALYKEFAFTYDPNYSGVNKLYRFWSSKNKAHFFTSSIQERTDTIYHNSEEDWFYEGVAYNVSDCSDVGSSKVYRFWSEQNRKHFYTNSSQERDQVINQYTDKEWLYEGEAFCAYSSDGGNMQPVYRFWSEQNHAHFYTASEQEKNDTIAKYTKKEWQFEGVAYFVKK